LLLDLIGRIALILEPDGPWSVDRYALEVFKAATNCLMSEVFQHVSGTGEPQPGAASKLQQRYGSDQKPEIIAQILARAVFVEHANEVFAREFGDKKKTAASGGATDVD
jgi:hypothetical protein